MENIIQIENVYRNYKTGEFTTSALNNISLSIKKGEIVVILGPSGSGKTTLLNVISGLDRVTKGSIYYEGKGISRYKDSKMTRFRKKNLGFIFQTYNLLEHLNVRENVLVGASLGKNKDSIDEIIDTVGLTKHKKKYIHELSGGEQQRIAIARALAKKPKVMFCDEPTGALDEKTGKKVLTSLVEANNQLNTTMIIVTHNPGIAAIANRVIRMNSGKIVEIKENEKRVSPKEISWG